MLFWSNCRHTPTLTRVWALPVQIVRCNAILRSDWEIEIREDENRTKSADTKRLNTEQSRTVRVLQYLHKDYDRKFFVTTKVPSQHNCIRYPCAHHSSDAHVCLHTEHFVHSLLCTKCKYLKKLCMPLTKCLLTFIIVALVGLFAAIFSIFYLNALRWQTGLFVINDGMALMFIYQISRNGQWALPTTMT